MATFFFVLGALVVAGMALMAPNEKMTTWYVSIAAQLFVLAALFSLPHDPRMPWAALGAASALIWYSHIRASN